MKKLEPFSDCFATKPAAQVDEKKRLVDGSYRCKWITLKLFPLQLPYARKTNQPTITNIDIIGTYSEQEHESRKESKTAKELVKRISEKYLNLRATAPANHAWGTRACHLKSRTALQDICVLARPAIYTDRTSSMYIGLADLIENLNIPPYSSLDSDWRCCDLPYLHIPAYCQQRRCAVWRSWCSIGSLAVASAWRAKEVVISLMRANRDVKKTLQNSKALMLAFQGVSIHPRPCLCC